MKQPSTFGNDTYFGIEEQKVSPGLVDANRLIPLKKVNMEQRNSSVRRAVTFLNGQMPQVDEDSTEQGLS